MGSGSRDSDFHNWVWSRSVVGVNGVDTEETGPDLEDVYLMLFLTRLSSFGDCELASLQ